MKIINLVKFCVFLFCLCFFCSLGVHTQDLNIKNTKNKNFLIQKDIEKLNTNVLVVGCSQSGIMSAIQASRLGSQVILICERNSIGGAVVEAGVSAIDGNELLAFQTGLWGEFLNKLAEKNLYLGEYGWVSLFTFDPRIGRDIFESWLSEEKNIKILRNYKPSSLIFQENNNKNIINNIP